MSEYKEIEINKIEVVENIRTATSGIAIPELMDSIKQQGLKTPILVTPKKDGKGYILVFGYRRLTACKKLGWKTIEARVENDLKREDILGLNAMENIQRVDISPTELGRVVDLMMADGLTTPEIAVKLGKPVGQVKTAVELYHELPEKFREKVAYTAGKTRKKGTIPAEVAKKVLEFGRDMTQKQKEDILHQVLEEDLSISDIGNVRRFMRAGMDVNEAVKSLKDIAIVNVDIPFEKETLEKLREKHDLSMSKLVKSIVYGKLPQLKLTKKEFLE